MNFQNNAGNPRGSDRVGGVESGGVKRASLLLAEDCCSVVGSAVKDAQYRIDIALFFENGYGVSATEEVKVVGLPPDLV